MFFVSNSQLLALNGSNWFLSSVSLKLICPKDMVWKQPASYRPHLIPSQKTFVRASFFGLVFSLMPSPPFPLLFFVSELKSDQNTDVMDLCSAFGHAEWLSALFFPPSHCQLPLRSEAADRKQAQLPEQGGLVSLTHTQTNTHSRKTECDKFIQKKQSGWELKETLAREVKLFSVMANDSVGTAIGMHEEKGGGGWGGDIRSNGISPPSITLIKMSTCQSWGLNWGGSCIFMNIFRVGCEYVKLYYRRAKTERGGEVISGPPFTRDKSRDENGVLFSLKKPVVEMSTHLSMCYSAMCEIW